MVVERSRNTYLHVLTAPFRASFFDKNFFFVWGSIGNAFLYVKEIDRNLLLDGLRIGEAVLYVGKLLLAAQLSGEWSNGRVQVRSGATSPVTR